MKKEMKNDKQMLFEMMEKINPGFGQMEEQPVTPGQAPQQAYGKMASDVKAMEKTGNRATSLNMAQSRINTTTEFPDAFKVWFGKLGYVPGKISIQQVITSVRKALTDLGYR